MLNVAVVSVLRVLAQTESSSLPKWVDVVQQHPIWIAGAALMAFMVAAIAFGDTLSGALSLFGIESPFRQKQPSVDELKALRNQLLPILKRDIQYRLDSSLHQLVKLDLEMEDQRQRVGRTPVTLVPEDLTPKPLEEVKSWASRSLRWIGLGKVSETELEPTQSLLTVLEQSDVQQKLLILGEPGAGKTTELVTLARDLLKRAEADPSAPIPIIFELSSWQNGKTIESWLIKQLKRLYSLNSSISQKWLKAGQIFLLLDGLDELGLTLQRQCITAINQFLEEKTYSSAVVCCRREEYEEGQVKFNQLNGALYLQPLNTQQIQTYLKKLNRYSLWKNISGSSELLNLAQQPLFLTMLVVAYQGRAISNASDLFKAYIQKQLEDPNSQSSYSPGKTPGQSTTLHYLNWLAKRMERSRETEYLIEDMQPYWLFPDYQRSYRLISGIIFGLISGLLIWLSAGLIDGLIDGLIFGSAFGLASGFFVSRPDIYWRLSKIEESSSSRNLENSKKPFMKDIQIKEKLYLPSEEFKKYFREGLLDGIYLGMIFGIISGVTAIQSRGPISGLFFGLIGFLSGDLGTAFGCALVNGTKSSNIEDKMIPNQGIRKSLQNGLFMTLVVGLISVFFYGLTFGLILTLDGELINGLTFGLIAGLCTGLVAGLYFGLHTVIKHYTLRFLLAREGSFPWDCVCFLDYAANLRFIQRVGGRYRFMHDLLRKHFAYGELPNYPD